MGGEAGAAAAAGSEGRVKSLGLVFEDEHKGSYSGGDTVAGHVLLEVAEPVALRALRLEARGRAAVAWSPSDSPATPASASEVEYLNVRLNLREAPAGEGVLLLQPGKHEFPFSFQLPSELLATSFTGKYGSIRYCVRAVAERPTLPAQSIRREFHVVGHIDVNTPALLTPVLKTQEKMVGCWFFTSGPVSLSAKIERKGYCNGEAIPIYAEIENCSSRLIVPKAAIFQTQTYVASGKTKTVRHMVANVRGNHIASGTTDTWNGKMLKIPPVTPSILGCRLIRVDYSLAVYIHIPGAKKLMLELPLVIGTIPYSGFGSRNCSMASRFSVDVSWWALTLPERPEAPPDYSDVVSEDEVSSCTPLYPQPPRWEGGARCPVFACVRDFRFQPPPLYSEVDPHPSNVTETRPVPFIL
ncbi:arrestin domain-containing protein 4 isoform X1 [Saccopteryx leptura]|uniref:arrestin domain-containing protein 4 isoform X1 n=1 Tax=Saccopteryx leptura TaxID=249018 RepID=UPI00339D21D6